MSEPKSNKTNNKEPKPASDSSKRGISDAYRYSGMGIKMAVVIFAGVYGGQKLDEAMGNGTPWMTILLSLVGVAIAIYIVISDTSK